jgi:uridine kinase
LEFPFGVIVDMCIMSRITRAVAPRRRTMEKHAGDWKEEDEQKIEITKRHAESVI